VSVRTPHPASRVSQRFKLGKAVYCELALGNGSPRLKSLLASPATRLPIIVGLQHSPNPLMNYLRHLVANFCNLFV